MADLEPDYGCSVLQGPEEAFSVISDDYANQVQSGMVGGLGDGHECDSSLGADITSVLLTQEVDSNTLIATDNLQLNVEIENSTDTAKGEDCPLASEKSHLSEESAEYLILQTQGKTGLTSSDCPYFVLGNTGECGTYQVNVVLDKANIKLRPRLLSLPPHPNTSATTIQNEILQPCAQDNLLLHNNLLTTRISGQEVSGNKSHTRSGKSAVLYLHVSHIEKYLYHY